MILSLSERFTSALDNKNSFALPATDGLCVILAKVRAQYCALFQGCCWRVLHTKAVSVLTPTSQNICKVIRHASKLVVDPQLEIPPGKCFRVC